MTDAPLKGIKVVELSTYVAAPCCGRMLADFGAEVIKIEAPPGDGEREFAKSVTHTGDDENPIFDLYNSNKKGVVLDLKTSRGKEILFKLLEEADVFLSNIRPQSLLKLGLDSESLMARYPRLIYAAMLSYGENGPEADSPGFDTTAFWARTGFFLDMVMETKDYYPIRGPNGVGDSIAGMGLFGGIMAALLGRERTGKGDKVTVSLYGTGIWVMGSMVLQAQKKYGEVWPKPRTAYDHISSIYRCKDGEWIAIVIIDAARYTPAFFQVIGHPELSHDPRYSTVQSRLAHSAEIYEFFDGIFRTKEAAEWIQLFNQADIVCQRLNHFKDVETDEQAWANDYLERFKLRNGDECVMPCPPIRLGSQGQYHSKPGPLKGEHTSEVLKGLGYEPEE
jgi:crotonobetainyl-CoA:carnitine CoA-transferase CaiB-like acyl-CoA transferase